MQQAMQDHIQEEARVSGKGDYSDTATEMEPTSLTPVDEKLGLPQEQEIVVDWDGDRDPENPLNWGRGRKIVCLFIISLFTFCSPLSATYPAGVSPQLAERYGIESPVVLALLTSSFCERLYMESPDIDYSETLCLSVIAFALGPLCRPHFRTME